MEMSETGNKSPPLCTVTSQGCYRSGAMRESGQNGRRTMRRPGEFPYIITSAFKALKQSGVTKLECR